VFFQREDDEADRQAGRAAIAAAGGNQQPAALPPRGPAPNPVPGIPIRIVPPAHGQQQQWPRCNIL